MLLASFDEENAIAPVSQEFVGKTNQQLWDTYGTSFGGAILPADAMPVSFVEGGVVGSAPTATPTTPPLYDMAGEGGGGILINPGTLTNFTPPSDDEEEASLSTAQASIVAEATRDLVMPISAPLNAERPPSQFSSRTAPHPQQLIAADSPITHSVQEGERSEKDEEIEATMEAGRNDDRADEPDHSVTWEQALDEVFGQLD